MAKSLNKLFLLGNVGKDPDIKATAGGTIVANFSLATADRVKVSDGWTEKTDWHTCVAFQKVAEIVRDYVKKGSQILVEGKVSYRSWDDKETGRKIYKTEVIVNEITLLGGKAERSESYATFDKPSTPATAASAYESDDIPF